MSSSSSAAAGGNFGAPPKPPWRMSADRRRLSTASTRIDSESGSSEGSSLPAAPSWARIRPDDSRIRSRWVAHDWITASITIAKLGSPGRGSGGK